MPLHDHFHAPLKGRRHWSSFHAAWATYIAEDLSERLPQGYIVEPLVQFAIEIDVATWEEPDGSPNEGARLAEEWAPSAPQMTLPLTIVTDVVEVKILRDEGGYVLAGAVELVSPSNKDRPLERDAFTSKCAAYLQQGAGLVVVDIVTNRRADFHRDLLVRVSQELGSPLHADLYAAAYRPMSREKQTTLEVWREPLTLGGVLPTMPLWLRGGICLPLRLETAYGRACRTLRIAGNGA
jgi:Protein of unknown function (DUF4058)